METILTDTIKSSMRILSKSAVIEQDINNSIAACKLDLQLAGVVNINENDALIIRAVTLFVKAEFNFQNAADRYRQSYEALKMSLCLAGDYNTKEGCEQINDSEVEKTIIFCDVESITQSEFEAVGQKDIKPQYKFLVWSFEYSNQTEIEYNGQRLTVYRTYKRKNEEKTELYAEKRVGRR